MAPHSSRRHGQTLGLAAVGLALSLGGGCGVYDYEKKLKETQDYLAYVDDENTYLGAPIVLPQKAKEGPAAPAAPAPAGAAPGGGGGGGGGGQEIFFRPPKGIVSEGATEMTDISQFRVFRYRKEGEKGPGGGPPGPPPGPPSTSTAPPKPPVKETPFQELYVAFAVNPDAKKFDEDVLGQLPDRHQPSYKKHSVTPVGRRPIEYHSWTDRAVGEGESLYYNIHLADLGGIHYRVLLAFKVDPAKATAEADYIQKQLRLSLESLAVGPDAATRYKTHRAPRVQLQAQ